MDLIARIDASIESLKDPDSKVLLMAIKKYKIIERPKKISNLSRLNFGFNP